MPERLIKFALEKDAASFVSEMKGKLQTAFEEVKSTIPEYIAKEHQPQED